MCTCLSVTLSPAFLNFSLLFIRNEEKNTQIKNETEWNSNNKKKWTATEVNENEFGEQKTSFHISYVSSLLIPPFELFCIKNAHEIPFLNEEHAISQRIKCAIKM